MTQTQIENRPKFRPFVISVTTDLHTDFMSACAQDATTASAVLRQAMREYLAARAPAGQGEQH